MESDRTEMQIPVQTHRGLSNADMKQLESRYFSGESLMRKRVRTCSDSNSMAERLATGSD